MNVVPLFVGIDVSKDGLDVGVRPTGEAWQVPHDPQGISSLTERLRELAPHFCLHRPEVASRDKVGPVEGWSILDRRF